MAKKYKAPHGGISVVTIGTIGTTAVNNQVWGLLQGQPVNSLLTIETRTRGYVQRSGTIKNFRIYLASNNASVPVVWTVYKNGAATAVTFTVPANSGAGWFSDEVNTVSLSSGDYIYASSSYAAGTGSFQVIFIGCDIEAAKPWVQTQLGANTTLAIAPNAAIQYLPVLGAKTSSSGTINQALTAVVPCQCDVITGIYLTANARTASSTLTLYVNGAASSSVLTIPAGTAGFLQNTTPITVNQGDILSFGLNITGGTGNITISSTTANFQSTTGNSIPVFSTNLTILGNSINRFYGVIGNAGANSTTEGPRFANFYGTSEARNLYHYVHTNTATTNGTVTVRKNSVNQALAVTVLAGVTGVVSNTTSTFDFANEDTSTLNASRSGSLSSSQGVTSFELVPDGVGGKKKAIWL